MKKEEIDQKLKLSIQVEVDSDKIRQPAMEAIIISTDTYISRIPFMVPMMLDKCVKQPSRHKYCRTAFIWVVLGCLDPHMETSTSLDRNCIPDGGWVVACSKPRPVRKRS